MSSNTPSSRTRPFSSKSKASGRKADANRIYAHPLPVTLPWTAENPHFEGVFDSLTRSVWVTKSEDVKILWTRGFFGKGDLSRSEPSWFARESNRSKASKEGKQLTSEEITARRRAERLQFKADRAKAIAAVAEEAEHIFATQGRVITPALSGPAIPSAATWKPSAPIVTDVAYFTSSSSNSLIPDVERSNRDTETGEAAEPLIDVEHLQLTLQEAFFLLWSLDCLTVLSPDTLEPMPLSQVWTTFQLAHLSPPPPSLPLHFDNPFLVHYVVYHHYRSLGWTIKSGIKFCVDYLLYKRGPVFAHAEFALVVCPVYDNPSEQSASSFSFQSEPFSWSWLSTLNRVNSQVQKTLVLVYVTIPSPSRLPLSILSSPACFAHYNIREVVVRRFIPAKMRD